MPRISKQQAPVLVDDATLEGRYAELGPYTAAFETFHRQADPAPLFRGLPDDRCQCEHWGFVRAGRLTFRYADHDEAFVEGDMYYAPPGHLPLPEAGTEIAEFSLTAALGETMAVVTANMVKEGAQQ